MWAKSKFSGVETVRHEIALFTGGIALTQANLVSS